MSHSGMHPMDDPWDILHFRLEIPYWKFQFEIHSFLWLLS
jgi:hypothetical protein